MSSRMLAAGAIFLCFLESSGGVYSTAAQAESALRLGAIQPTILFPQEKDGAPLRQLVDVEVTNAAEATGARLRATVDGQQPCEIDLGVVERGKSTRRVGVPDRGQRARITFELFAANSASPSDMKTVQLPPAIRWKIYCVSYSHHDLGYADYYQKIQRDIRLGSLERALDFCRQTDDWDEPSRFRWLMESSVPLTSFVEHFPPPVVDELVRRVNEGRIEWGACHNTAAPDIMDVELVSRLFYTPNRHGRDLLGIGFSPVGVISDVVGLPWSFATFTKETDLPYFYFSPNRMARCLEPAFHVPVFYWQSPDGDAKQTLFRVVPYNYPHPESLANFQTDTVCRFIARYEGRPDYPFDCVLALDTNDFTVPSLSYASGIRQWNAQWRYPQLVCATMKMFFEDVAAQLDASKVPVFAKDATSAWADQEATDAWLLGQARNLEPQLTAAETFSTIAAALAGGGYPWQDLWEAYNRLLMYHEHTNAADAGHPRAIGRGKDAYPQYYETEQSMHRALVEESRSFSDRAAESAFSKLERLIATAQDATLIVFNPLARQRTDVVHAKIAALPESFRLVETGTSRDVPWQRLDDGSLLFLSENVPALGYQTYAVLPAQKPPESTPGVKAEANVLENAYYAMVFDPATGAIVSVFDKELHAELVDGQSPHQFNEYLYQHSTPRRGELEWRNSKTASLTTSAGPVLGRMVAQVRAAGCRSLRQSVILYAGVKRVDFVQELDREPSGMSLPDYQGNAWSGREAAYFALPFKISGFTVRHDIPGAVIEPIADQFPGASTAYYAVQHFTDLSNREFGVTLAPRESPLVEYGKPRVANWLPPWRHPESYESELRSPERSHLYFYVMNNFFPVNIRCDQRGPVVFRWSLRSHRGDWREGKAAEFGDETAQPLIARLARGKKAGPLPPDRCSFLSVDRANVALSTVKMAEANGEGIIVRLHELEGRGGPVTLTCPFLPSSASAKETSLIEDDRSAVLPVQSGNAVTVKMRPFGVKTIRLLAGHSDPPPTVAGLEGRAVSDMQVELRWQLGLGADETVCHYLIYRGTEPTFPLTLRYCVGAAAETHWTDQPRRSIGGWVSNRLAPETTYYYKVAAVDRWNRRGPASAQTVVRTLSAKQADRPPEPVQGLHVVQVSPLEACNFLALWFYSNIEPDVVAYHVHRGASPGFEPTDGNRIGKIDLAEEIDYDTLWGVHVRQRLGEYDRQIYRDENIQPGTTYYYKVCAVDAAGNRGAFLPAASGQTKPGWKR